MKEQSLPESTYAERLALREPLLDLIEQILPDKRRDFDMTCALTREGFLVLFVQKLLPQEQDLLPSSFEGHPVRYTITGDPEMYPDTEIR